MELNFIEINNKFNIMAIVIVIVIFNLDRCYDADLYVN